MPALIDSSGEVQIVGGHTVCEAMEIAHRRIGDDVRVVPASAGVERAWRAEQERARKQFGLRGYRWSPVMVDVVDGVAELRGGE